MLFASWGFGEVVDLLVGEQSAFDQEAFSCGNFDTERGTAAWSNIEGEVRVFPVFVLGRGHVEGGTVDITEEHIDFADFEIIEGEAHGGASVATTATLVEHDRAVKGAQFVHEFFGGWGEIYSIHDHFF